MKKLITQLVIGCLLSVAIGYIAYEPQDDNPPNQSTILLQGSLDTNAGPNDVEAYVDEYNIYINFHRSFGNVNITLYNPFGLTVYHDVINTNIQNLVVIPISGLPEGTYTIVLEKNSNYLDGDFEK